MTTKTITHMFVIIFLLLGITRAANNWEEFAVRSTSDDQGQPDISGTLVVWHQFVAEYGDYDLHDGRQ